MVRLQHEMFNEITVEAQRQMGQYLNMDARATHRSRELRKEDFLNYWVAVVAFSYGHTEGLVNGL